LKGEESGNCITIQMKNPRVVEILKHGQKNGQMMPPLVQYTILEPRKGKVPFNEVKLLYSDQDEDE